MHSILMFNVNWIKTIPLMHGSMISISIGLFVINHSSELYWQRQWIIEQNLKIYRGKIRKITRAINIKYTDTILKCIRKGRNESIGGNNIYNHIKRHSIRFFCSYRHHFCCYCLVVRFCSFVAVAVAAGAVAAADSPFQSGIVVLCSFFFLHPDHLLNNII